MSAQPIPISQPPMLTVLSPTYNHSVAITNLMVILVSTLLLKGVFDIGIPGDGIVLSPYAASSASRIE